MHYVDQLTYFKTDLLWSCVCCLEVFGPNLGLFECKSWWFVGNPARNPVWKPSPLSRLGEGSHPLHKAIFVRAPLNLIFQSVSFCSPS